MGDRFKEFVEMLPEPVFEIDASGRLTFMNRMGLKRFGITPAEIKRGFSLEEVVVPEERERARANIQRVLDGLSPLPSSEYTMIGAEGLRLPHLLTARPVLRNGKIGGLQGLLVDISERKKNEKTQVESEEKLRLAVESACIGIHSTDLETGRIDWSPEHYEIAGLPYGSITTREQAWTVVHPEDFSRAQEASRRGLDPESGGRFFSEHRIVRPDGEVRWVIWQGRTFFRETPQGPVPFWRIGICRDVTDRKKAQIALEESERKFSLMFNASPVSMGISTFAEGRFLAVNPAECLLTGYSMEELIGHDIEEIGFYVDPEDGRALRRLIDEKGHVSSHRFRLRRKSGQILWCLASASPIEYQGQKCLIFSNTDITPLQKMEEALRLSEGRLRMAIDGANLGLWDLDWLTGLATCNDNYYAMHGYAPQEFQIYFETWKGLIHPEDRPYVMDRISAAFFEGAELGVLEYRMLQKDGSYRWIRDAMRVIDRDENGNVRRAAGIHIDIDDKKRAEEILRGEKNILEKLVRRRTAALEASLSKLKEEISVRRQAVEELKARTGELDEMNSALKLVLRKTREERLDAEKRVTNAFEDTLKPILTRLKLTKLASPSAAYVKLLDEALTKLASTSIASLLDLQHKLSPSESQVAGLILQGHRTKEIAEILLLSRRTIESHRKKIRRKLGLQRSKTNLKNYLFSLNSPPK